MIVVLWNQYQCRRDGCGWRPSATDNLEAEDEVKTHLIKVHDIPLGQLEQRGVFLPQVDITEVQMNRDRVIATLQSMYDCILRALVVLKAAPPGVGDAPFDTVNNVRIRLEQERDALWVAINHLRSAPLLPIPVSQR